MIGTAVAHNGDPIEFETHGSGPTLMVWAHPRMMRGPGGAPMRRLCKRIVADIGPMRRIVFVKYPWPAKPDTLTPANVNTDLLAVADAAGADEFGWWGYSWGAVIGLQLAVASPRVTTLICGGFPPLGGPYAAMLELGQILDRRLSRLPLIRLPAPRRVRNSMRQWVTYYSGLQDFDDEAAQASLTGPRLAFAGGADRVVLGKRHLADLGPVLLARQPDLEAYGWDVRVLPALKHRGAAQPEVMVPLVAEWLRGKTVLADA